jgi:hypothetical protein
MAEKDKLVMVDASEFNNNVDSMLEFLGVKNSNSKKDAGAALKARGSYIKAKGQEPEEQYSSQTESLVDYIDCLLVFKKLNLNHVRNSLVSLNGSTNTYERKIILLPDPDFNRLNNMDLKLIILNYLVEQRDYSLDDAFADYPKVIDSSSKIEEILSLPTYAAFSTFAKYE